MVVFSKGSCPLKRHITSVFDVSVILRRCCERLGLHYTGKERLLYASEWVPRRTRVNLWPFVPPCGEVTDYQMLRE
eukprot:6484705-Amphidinium_carterae.1